FSWPLASVEATLSNGQRLMTVHPSFADPLDRRWTVEMQPLRYVQGPTVVSTREGEQALQAMPTQRFVSLIRGSHSYHCVLNPKHRSEFKGAHVRVRNSSLE